MDESTKVILSGIQSWLVALTIAQSIVTIAVTFFAARLAGFAGLEKRVRKIEDAMHSCDACRSALALVDREARND